MRLEEGEPTDDTDEHGLRAGALVLPTLPQPFDQDQDINGGQPACASPHADREGPALRYSSCLFSHPCLSVKSVVQSLPIPNPVPLCPSPPSSVPAVVNPSQFLIGRALTRLSCYLERKISLWVTAWIKERNP